MHFKFGDFTLLFGRLRQRIVLKRVPHVQHVQHDYFFMFLICDVVAVTVVLS